MNSRILPLKRVASVRISNVDKKIIEGDEPVRLCNYTDVYYQNVIRADQDFMAATASRQQVLAFRLQPGDVIITKDSETPDDIGVPCYVETTAPDLVCGYHLAIVRSEEQVINGRFLYWSMVSAAVGEQLATAAKGVTRHGLRTDSIGGVIIHCPPIQLQRVIVEFLDFQTARIDALIARKLELSVVIEQRWRAQVRHEVMAAGARHGWVPLKSLVRCLDGRRIPLNAEERSVRDGDVPYYGASGVIDHVDDWLFDEELVLLGEDGAQLGDPDCEISFVVQGKCWVNNHAHVLRPQGADANFLALHLSCMDRSLLISGATREKLTQEDMRVAPVPRLPLAEQVHLGSRLRRNREVARTLTGTLERQVALLQERRQALITAAVTGELDIPGAA